MKIDITEDKMKDLISKYYSAVGCIGLSNTSEKIIKNTIDSKVIIDEIFEPIAINTNFRNSSIDSDIWHFTGRLILPYNYYCRVDKNVFIDISNCSGVKS